MIENTCSYCIRTVEGKLPKGHDWYCRTYDEALNLVNVLFPLGGVFIFRRDRRKVFDENGVFLSEFCTLTRMY